jgi:osmotically-inducible protein OsmY
MITCHFEDGVLTLRGKLPSFYLKQLAQEAVREVHRVRRVINEIEVTPD